MHKMVPNIDRAIKFGRRRAMLVLDHTQAVRDFKMRQIELAATTALMLLFAMTSPVDIARIITLAMAMVFIGLGTQEAARFRACGRSYQCRRSIEVVGF